MPIERMPHIVNAKTREEYLAEFIGITYKKLNELIDNINEITREDKNTVVSMVTHKGEVIMATKYKIYKLVNDEFIELKFIVEE